MSDVMSRVAGAPITWGVDGSPGWGHLMDVNRVLAEMQEVGLHATELGPDGYLPTDPDELREMLESYGLVLVGGFVPALLYREDAADEQLDYVARAARTLAGCGSEVIVLGPSSHFDGYDHSVEMTEQEWTIFLSNLQKVIVLCWPTAMSSSASTPGTCSLEGLMRWRWRRRRRGGCLMFT